MFESVDQTEVRFVTIEGIDQRAMDNPRLPEPIGDVPPTELVRACYERRDGHEEAA